MYEMNLPREPRSCRCPTACPRPRGPEARRRSRRWTHQGRTRWRAWTCAPQ
jgi:hypothetical protein